MRAPPQSLGCRGFQTADAHHHPLSSPAAKERHPDLNKDDPFAAEKFKKLTAAYTTALREAGNREKGQPSDLGSDPHTGRPSTPTWENRARWEAGAARAGKEVDPRRYNVKEWERAHYGMHDPRTGRFATTAERQMSDKVRQMARQAREMNAQSRARMARPHSNSGFGWFMASVAACTAVWTLVYTTNAGRLAYGGGGTMKAVGKSKR